MTSRNFNHCIKRIRAGDMRAVEPIYNEYYEKMIIVARRIVKSLDAAICPRYINLKL